MYLNPPEYRNLYIGVRSRGSIVFWKSLGIQWPSPNIRAKSLSYIMSTTEKASAKATQNSVMSGTASALANIVQVLPGDESATSMNDFFGILDQVAEMGSWTDAQKLRTTNCRRSGTACELTCKGMRAKIAKEYSEVTRNALQRLDAICSSLKLRRCEAIRKAHEDVHTCAWHMTPPTIRAKEMATNRPGELMALFVGGLKELVSQAGIEIAGVPVDIFPKWRWQRSNVSHYRCGNVDRIERSGTETMRERRCQGAIGLFEMSLRHGQP